MNLQQLVENYEEYLNSPKHHLSELVRSLSRIANRYPKALTDFDLERLNDAKKWLKENTSYTNTPIKTQLTPPCKQK